MKIVKIINITKIVDKHRQKKKRSSPRSLSNYPSRNYRVCQTRSGRFPNRCCSYLIAYFVIERINLVIVPHQTVARLIDSLERHYRRTTFVACVKRFAIRSRFHRFTPRCLCSRSTKDNSRKRRTLRYSLCNFRFVLTRIVSVLRS